MTSRRNAISTAKRSPKELRPSIGFVLEGPDRRQNNCHSVESLYPSATFVHLGKIPDALTVWWRFSRSKTGRAANEILGS
jgi:hypothetical protein